MNEWFYESQAHVEYLRGVVLSAGVVTSGWFVAACCWPPQTLKFYPLALKKGRKYLGLLVAKIIFQM